MGSHNVEYQISLKDLLSGKIKEAESHVNHFEGALEHTKNVTKELMGAAVGFFGLYQGIEFIKSSVEAYNNVEKSLSQLRAGLKSTGGAAGVTYEELTEGAERFAASTIYNKEALLDMQAQLLSFPEVSHEVFEQAEQAIMDLATRTGHSLHDVSIMVGKALGDPTKGITALRRVGVEFSQSQTEVIKKLAETGHVAQAQQMILKELGREYAGSTSAASATAGGQMEILKHRFDEVKESIGKLVMEETIKLAPTLKALIEDFKHLVEWVDKNKETIIDVTKAVVEVTATIWLFGKANAAIEGTIALWETLRGVVIGTGAAMEATAGAGAAKGLGAAEGLAAEGAITEGSIMAGGASLGSLSILGGAAIVALNGLAIWNFIKDLTGDFGNDKKTADERQKDWDVSQGAIPYAAHIESNLKAHNLSKGQFYVDEIGNLKGTEFADEFRNMFTAKPMGHYEGNKYVKGENYHETTLKNIDKIFADLVNDKEALKLLSDKSGDKAHSEAITAWIGKEQMKYYNNGKKENTTHTLLNEAQSTVQGQSVKNTYVTINGGLIHDFTIKTTNLKEATPDIKRIVTQTLTDGINDSELNN